MFLGIEIGGTKLQLAVGGGDGVLAELVRHRVDTDRGAKGILEQIEVTGKRLIAEHGASRVGFGFGGPVNSQQGRVVTSHQVKGWKDFPLVQWCQDTLQRPAVLGNDCDVAALAEARFGAGRARQVVFFVTVGTGIGGGLVVGGRLFGSGRPAIAEIGHLRPGLDCDQPQMTVESRSAGPAIERMARDRLESDTASSDDRTDLLGRCERAEALTAQDVAEAARDGNGLAKSVFDDACHVLGWAIAQVITLTAPEVVVVGGGVSLSGEQVFFEPLRRSVASYVFPPLGESYQIVSAGLGEEVVVHGALALAAQTPPLEGHRA